MASGGGMTGLLHLHRPTRDATAPAGVVRVRCTRCGQTWVLDPATWRTRGSVTSARYSPEPAVWELVLGACPGPAAAGWEGIGSAAGRDERGDLPPWEGI